MKTKESAFRVYRDAIDKAVVPGQLKRLLMSAECDQRISSYALTKLRIRAEEKREKLLRVQYCWRRSCKYWRDPTANAFHSCDYMMLTGRSRIKQIEDPRLRKDYGRCPLFEPGKRPKLRKVKPGLRGTKYNWAVGMALYRSGATDREIAEELGCSRKAVQWWRRNHKLPCNREDERDTGEEP
ncbi:MAG: hypothetical protein IK149_01635 [Oscillospiraceae bacterium]|nr:hypothetical protein [Oscillospiraceae bacterium]